MSRVRSNTDISGWEDQSGNERKYGRDPYYDPITWVNRRNTGVDLPRPTNDNRYKGQYNNGKRHGKGTYIYANGSTYTGDWVDGKKMGQGVFTWFDGDQYEIRYSQICCDHLLP